MKKIYLYAHDGSKNHGCEALVRSTVELIKTVDKEVVLVSARPEEDLQYGLDQICKVIEKGKTGDVRVTATGFWKAYLRYALKKGDGGMKQLAELSGMDAKKGDCALSIGGDTYCYGATWGLIQSHNMWIRGGVKTVYWGCSIEPELLEDESIARDISRYDLVTARETISYEALKKVNSNTVLVSDTAFLLNKKEVHLPERFGENGIVGINASPLIEKSETSPEIVRKNYYRLIEYLLKQTQMDVLLVPHVVWDFNDDRTVLTELMSCFPSTDRIHLVDDCSCEMLKGYISKCSFFVGARTHSTIAAYSTEVPTLVVGYSVKSKGIARDLFGNEDHYVLPVQKMENENDLTNAFRWLQNHESDIKNTLHSVLPEYKQRAFTGIQRLMEL